MSDGADAGVPTLHTRQLTLRSWCEGDVEAYARLAAEPEVMRYVGPRRPLTRAEAASDVARFVRHWAAHGHGHWAIEERASGRFIGRVGLHHHADWLLDADNVEVGWILARAVWGRGYATEAAFAALAFGFAQRRLPRIISITDPHNAGSLRVMEKVGLDDGGVTRWRGHAVRWRSAERDAWLSDHASVVRH